MKINAGFAYRDRIPQPAPVIGIRFHFLLHFDELLLELQELNDDMYERVLEAEANGEWQVLLDMATRNVLFAGSREASALDGDDTVKAFENQLEASVEAGQGDNIIILGGGADELALGDGNNFILGDSGAIDYRVGVFTSNVDVAEGADPAAAFAGDDDLRFGSGVNALQQAETESSRIFEAQCEQICANLDDGGGFTEVVRQHL